MLLPTQFIFIKRYRGKKPTKHELLSEGKTADDRIWVWEGVIWAQGMQHLKKNARKHIETKIGRNFEKVFIILNLFFHNWPPSQTRLEGVSNLFCWFWCCCLLCFLCIGRVLISIFQYRKGSIIYLPISKREQFYLIGLYQTKGSIKVQFYGTFNWL